jgi:hypothetical protein
MKLNLSFEEIKEIEKKAAAKAKKTNEEIDAILTKATQKSLNDITQRGYHNIANHLGTNKIIDLGLAIYGNVPNIKAAFGPV